MKKIGPFLRESREIETLVEKRGFGFGEAKETRKMCRRHWFRQSGNREWWVWVGI